MTNDFPNLFSPLRLGSLTLKNRIISSPMTWPVLTSDGCLTPQAVAFYEQRAKGGAAAVTVSEASVHSATGKNYAVQICLDNPNVLTGLSQAARAIHRHGAAANLNMAHAGMYALCDKLDAADGGGFTRYGPTGCSLSNGLPVLELSHGMIKTIIKAFADGALTAKRAGFDMVLIHAGHGWLPQQFFSLTTNRRTDEYGGQSIANRARFTVELLEAVRGAVGADFPIELRMSASEYCAGGYTMDEALAFAQTVEPYINLLHVSTGTHEGSFFRTHLPMFELRGGNVKYAAAIKRGVHIPVAAIGALNDPAMMEDIIASGSADAVELARALLADPYLPKKAESGRADEILHCCRCFTCMSERLTTGLRSCALNPVIGDEYEAALTPPPLFKKKVLVAGGGPGGMEAAITAARRGHGVILCERSGRLGGALNSEAHISFKSDLYDFIRVKSRELTNAGVEVRLNTPVTPELALSLSPDVIIAAIGGEAVVPPIPGAESALRADAMPEASGLPEGSAVVIGGGLVGCESALSMAMAGHRVTVLEMGPKAAPDANGRHRPILMEKLAQLGVEILTNRRVTRVSPGGVVAREPSGKETLYPCAFTVLAAGRRPLSASALRCCAPEVIELGDCVKTGLVRDAVFRGYHAALDIGCEH